MFLNPGLYKHLKAATKDASDLLRDIKSGKTDPPSDINAEIANEDSFVSCVGYLMESYDIEWITLLPNENRLDGIRKTLLYHIKKYLGSPYLKIEGTHIFMGDEEDIISHSFPDYFISFFLISLSKSD